MSAEDSRRFFQEQLRETQARELEARAHNLQSDYDTQIRGTQEELSEILLPRMRGAISQGLHLLEATTALCHLMERHEGYQKIPEAKATLSRYLDWEALRQLILENLVGMAYQAFQNAQEPATQVIQHLTTPSFIEIELPEDVQIHARPLSLVVRIVNHFETPVELEVAGERASAASMMGLLVLVGSHPESRSLRFHGDERALQALKALIEAGMGERGMDALPESLDFLQS